MAAFFAVLLNKKVFASIKKEWVENLNDSISKVYYSPDKLSIANFDLPIRSELNNSETACYNGIVCKGFGAYTKFARMNFH